MFRMKVSGRIVAVAIAVVALGAFLAATADAAEWKPTKPIQLIVPYAPGGGSDVLARSIGQIIQSAKLNPTPLIVINHAGSSGTVGTASVAQSPGNENMLLTFVSGQVAAPLTAGKGTVTYKDLTLIGNLAIDEQLIVVKWDSPYKSITEVVEAAKKKSGTITIGGTATGQEDQMCNRIFERAAGITLRYIPFNSGGEVITALLAGHTELAWANPSEFFPQWEAKLVRPLAVAKETRLAKFPDAPTFKEKGLDVTFKMFRGIAAPPGIPPAVTAYYENMMKKVAETPAWKEKYLDQYMLSPNWMGSKEFAAFVAQNEMKFKPLLTELGLVK